MTSVMSQVQYYLGLLTANLVNVLDPEMVVFGGGVVEALGDDFSNRSGRPRASLYFAATRRRPGADRAGQAGRLRRRPGARGPGRQMTSRRRR